MKNTAARRMLIWVFLVILFVPTVLWCFLGNCLKDENFEKRVLAEWPVFSLEKLETLPTKYNRYYEDHLPFRNQLITGYVGLTRALFHADLNDYVTFGKSGWMFYTNVNDGDPIASYRGEDLLSMEQLRKITVELKQLKNRLKEKGVEFVLYIAPNKERVYSEYMPDKYGQPADNYAVKQLFYFLTAHTDIQVVYPFDALMQAKRDLDGVDLFHPTDTHWNEAGAYIGTKTLADALGVELPALHKENIHREENVFIGDMIYLSLQTYTMGKQPVNTVSGIFLPKDNRKLLIEHDSFMDNMLPYLNQIFAECEAVHYSKYSEDLVDTYHPDVMIMEMSERFMRRRLL